MVYASPNTSRTSFAIFHFSLLTGHLLVCGYADGHLDECLPKYCDRPGAINIAANTRYC